MAIWDLFSKRQKRKRGEVPDVYTYDELPQKLRVQIVHIWRSVLSWVPPHDVFWERVAAVIRREVGVFRLNHEDDPEHEIARYFLEENDVELALDVVEVVFGVAPIARRQGWETRDQTPEAGVEELNQRFRWHGVGYKFEQEKIIRIDSEFLHREVVKPALAILHNPEFAGPNAEFLKAHEHYRHGRNQESLVEAGKALESTFKVIFDRRGWPYDPRRTTLSGFVDTAYDKGLIPEDVKNQFGGLRTILQNALILRNRRAAHGGGAGRPPIPGHVVTVNLNLTASLIVFLVECDRAMA
ncbi:MAG: hypothetical protein H6739_29330 [Alphaproteobacteria bacterium]|nr:hypothetical protein [Alphaproteobacteria bacterium]